MPWQVRLKKSSSSAISVSGNSESREFWQSSVRGKSCCGTICHGHGTFCLAKVTTKRAGIAARLVTNEVVTKRAGTVPFLFLLGY